MAKQKKNSNYVTEKTTAAKAQKEEEARRAKQAKLTKTILIAVGSALAVIAIIIGILFALGAFEYFPVGTYDAVIDIEGYGQIHVSLYGNDAPDTVQHFINMAEDGYFDGMHLHTFLNGMLYGGSMNASASTGVKGEFKDNGFNNKIKLTKGTLAMARGEDPNSAYGQFFIATEDMEDLSDKYASFGRIDDMSIIEKILEDIELNDDGTIKESTAPRIITISTHEAHDH